MSKITAREELYDHLKYLIGHDDANKLIDQFKNEILKDTNFYEMRNKDIQHLKEKIISSVYDMPPYCYHNIEIYNQISNSFVVESRPMIDRVEVINSIKNITDKEVII